MKCHQSPALERYADGEADELQRERVALHLKTCALCSADLERLADLRVRLRTELPRHTAPAALRARVMAAVAAHRTSGTGRSGNRFAGLTAGRPRWVWMGNGMVIGGLLTAVSFLAIASFDAWTTGRELTRELVAAHGRASLTGHVVDIESSDRHTVKPWLSARLDYSPPVADLKEQGYALIGGRLDQIQRAPVATLVYRYGHHSVDVFVRPLTAKSHPIAPVTLRGFNVVQTRGAGMEWIGVSDLNARELTGLMERLANP